MPAPLRALAASRSSPARRATRSSPAPATWSSRCAAGAIGSPCRTAPSPRLAGRFLQWKAVLHAGGALGSVGVNYLPVNSAPVVDELVVVPGARLNPQNSSIPQNQTVNISFPSPSQSSTISFDAGSSAAAAGHQRSHRRHRSLGGARRRWRRPDLFALPARRRRDRLAACSRTRSPRRPTASTPR